MIVLLLFVFIVFGSYLVHMYHYQKHWMENFDVSLEFSEEQAREGEQLFLYETVSNNKKMCIPSVCVKFQTSKFLQFEDETSGIVSDYFYRNDVMSVDGFQKVRRKLRFTCKKRGLYTIEGAELVSYDLLYTQTFVHKKAVHASLCVYPSLVDIRKFLPAFQQTLGTLATNVPLFEDPYAFVGVREYTPQDSMRRIHWKTSARTGHWQVKTTEYSASTPVVLVLNLESPGVFVDTDLMEDSIRLAHSFVTYFCKNGVATRLVTAGDERMQMEGGGQFHLQAARRALAVISYAHVCCDGISLLNDEVHWDKNAHIILISAAGKEPMQEKVAELLSKGYSISWIAPVVSSDGRDNEFRNLLPSIQRILVKWGGGS